MCLHDISSTALGSAQKQYILMRDCNDLSQKKMLSVKCEILFRKYRISTVHYMIFCKPNAKLCLGNCCVNGKWKPCAQKIVLNSELQREIVFRFFITYIQNLSFKTKLKLLNVRNNSAEKCQCPRAGATWHKRLSFISSLIILCLVSV